MEHFQPPFRDFGPCSFDCCSDTKYNAINSQTEGIVSTVKKQTPAVIDPRLEAAKKAAAAADKLTLLVDKILARIANEAK